MGQESRYDIATEVYIAIKVVNCE